MYKHEHSQVEIYQSPIELKEPFITSFGPDTHAENVVVVIRTSEGITGFGECNPYMPICGESMQTAFITGQYLAKLLIGKDPLPIEDHHAAFDKLIYANASIKSAFDIALYDIASQHAESSAVCIFRWKKRQNTDHRLYHQIDDADKMASDAIKIVANGFTVIKVKLGESKEKDVERFGPSAKRLAIICRCE